MSPLGLVGAWRLDRRIDDRHAEVVLQVDGTLELAADGKDRVDWHERGTLRRPGSAPAEVTRSLCVVRRAEVWWVLFDHGGDFHPWTPQAWVEHPCGADTYRGLVDLGPDGWAITWKVTGPAKDYTMHTRLTRA